MFTGDRPSTTIVPTRSTTIVSEATPNQDADLRGIPNQRLPPVPQGVYLMVLSAEGDLAVEYGGDAGAQDFTWLQKSGNFTKTYELLLI